MPKRRLELLALLALVLAAAYPMQVNGWNQNAHYALVRALAAGTPSIDKSRTEIGDLGTGDVARVNGHTYSNKAPGLAFAAMPAYVVVDAVGMRTTGDPTRVIWALHLWALVGAFAALLLLVRSVAERLAPGYGTLAAVVSGAGTLLLPFSTLFFAHVLSAALGFAAFAALLRERQRAPRLALVAAGGLLAGLAVTTEYSLGLLALILGGYALARADRVRRAAAYAGGLALGVLPLLAFNLWAFGSPFHTTYEGNALGGLGGFFGLRTPSLRLLDDVLFSMWGLLTLTPVVAAGVAGAVLALRRARAEAVVVLAVAGIYLAWSISFAWQPFGGLGPPRYLMMIFPFLGVGLALALRELPLTTLTLGAVSVFQMTVITATNPLAAYDGNWIGRLGSRAFSETGASIVGITGWYAILPLFAAIAVAAGAALAAAPPLPGRVRDLALALGALAAWAVVAVTATNPNGRRLDHAYVLGLALLCALAAASVLARPGVLASTRLRKRSAGAL